MCAIPGDLISKLVSEETSECKPILRAKLSDGMRVKCKGLDGGGSRVPVPIIDCSDL